MRWRCDALRRVGRLAGSELLRRPTSLVFQLVCAHCFEFQISLSLSLSLSLVSIPFAISSKLFCLQTEPTSSFSRRPPINAPIKLEPRKKPICPCRPLLGAAATLKQAPLSNLVIFCGSVRLRHIRRRLKVAQRTAQPLRERQLLQIALRLSAAAVTKAPVRAVALLVCHLNSVLRISTETETLVRRLGERVAISRRVVSPKLQFLCKSLSFVRQPGRPQFGATAVLRAKLCAAFYSAPRRIAADAAPLLFWGDSPATRRKAKTSGATRESDASCRDMPRCRAISSANFKIARNWRQSKTVADTQFA